MATACALYKGPIKLGTGTIAAGSATVSSWSAVSMVLPFDTSDMLNRNVTVQITGAGAWQGDTFNTNITADGGSTLTMKDACPYVGA